MDFSDPRLIRLRNAARRLGILQPLQWGARHLRRAGYEERFDREVMRHLQPGDTVWDVGANIGLYTKKFADRVGETGRVVAFEPSPGSFQALSAEIAGRHNVVCANLALSNFNGEAEFRVGVGGTSPTDGLMAPKRPAAPDGTVCIVAVQTGDSFAAEHPELAPNKIKIDVEGFEDDVLAGLHEQIDTARLTGLFIEVHFGVLEARGRASAPERMCEMLRRQGFTVRWTDPSHLCALR